MASPPLPRLLFFLSFLLLGIVSGFFAGSLGKASASIGILEKSAQENSLIVYVDDLSSDHYSIKGIWLAASFQGSPEISWMPIYPAPLATKSDFSEPHSPLILESIDIENLKFLAPLRLQGAWWSNVLLLDDAAIGILQALTGLQPVSLSDTWTEPQRALHEQVELLQTLCSTPGTWLNQTALDQVLALIPAHMNTSISPFELITRWDNWSADGFALNCNHPWADQDFP